MPRNARFIVCLISPYDDKNNTIDEICKTLDISRATLYRYIDVEEKAA
jgi:response regulator of citrate/malate metabolism